MRKADRFIVANDTLQTDAGSIQVGSREWFAWLLQQEKFSYQGKNGHFMAQRETRRKNTFWYAYRRRDRKLYKQYLGKSDELTPERLEQASNRLAGQNLFKQYANQPDGERAFDTEARIDTSFLPMTKVNNPVLPPHLLTRPRLASQINTPITLISAPSGFGKSTLLNDWKRSCGFPVAWLALDESDNQPARFWHSVVLALQTIQSGFGEELLKHLQTASPIHLSEVLSRLTNDILSSLAALPRFGLVLDNFQHITQTEITSSIQDWLEHFPPNMQLVIVGHTRPALALGHLRARGLVTELDANDLRFTLEEGVHYLRQYPQAPALAHTQLERLVKHTEGWAAGLTLTAIALGKQEDPRRFLDTFSGAHIYLREYFMETVLQRSSEEVQAFLLKTAILKHLTGSLCDAVCSGGTPTGQTSGEEMLLRLWQENLFIDRLEQQGWLEQRSWYRYHDLFAEMLLSQLQARFPQEVRQLHQRAARWYHDHNAPADAVYHLFAIDAWEEAASLIESMALRELEQYGEDSRLLRWLQELPEEVVQKHKTLLFVYLRLADVALPKQKMERFIARIETNLSLKPVNQQTQDEREVLDEISRIRGIWSQGALFTPSMQEGDENAARWEVLNGIQLLKQEYISYPEVWENQLGNLLHKAQAQGNLFVILMVGGVLARGFLVTGQLRRGEKIARQVLDQALKQRGKLPEPASIALAVLSQVSLERGELGPAQRYLTQAQEVDPNPTSTNMPVQNAILHAKILVAQGKGEEALAVMKSTRELHTRRPSGMWTDQDLLAYEALILLRKGDTAAAEQMLNESEGSAAHGLSQLLWAEVWLANDKADAAEELLNRLIVQNPYGISYEPLLGARVLLALAAFKQNKNHFALQMISEAVRLAAPERFYRPFLENGTGCHSGCAALLLLARNTDKWTGEAQAFLKEILRLSGNAEAISPAEIEALSISASISQREQEVLNLLSSGYTNSEMAETLSVSESTVKTHLRNIYTKLGVNSRTQAVKSAKDLKLIR